MSDPHAKQVHLDDMLTPQEAGEWLKASGRQVALIDIPVFKLGHKTRRYHPRTVVAVLARRAGVPLDVIAASFGMPPKENP